MYGDEERNRKMEKGEHLKRQNRPTMLQLQYLQGLSRIEKNVELREVSQNPMA